MSVQDQSGGTSPFIVARVVHVGQQEHRRNKVIIVDVIHQFWISEAVVGWFVVLDGVLPRTVVDTVQIDTHRAAGNNLDGGKQLGEDGFCAVHAEL